MMIGRVLGNDFSLILIIIGNVPRMRGLNLLYGQGNGIRTLTAKRILELDNGGWVFHGTFIERSDPEPVHASRILSP